MPATKTTVFRFADVEVREREFSLTKAGEVLPVEPKAFRVLLAPLRNPGKLIGKEELLYRATLEARIFMPSPWKRSRRAGQCRFSPKSPVPASRAGNRAESHRSLMVGLVRHWR